MSRRHPKPPPFPYTTLFRSWDEPAAGSGGGRARRRARGGGRAEPGARGGGEATGRGRPRAACPAPVRAVGADRRSEEHTSELQSLRQLVCRLLLEKKKQHRQ